MNERVVIYVYTMTVPCVKIETSIHQVKKFLDSDSPLPYLYVDGLYFYKITTSSYIDQFDLFFFSDSSNTNSTSEQIPVQNSTSVKPVHEHILPHTLNYAPRQVCMHV